MNWKKYYGYPLIFFLALNIRCTSQDFSGNQSLQTQPADRLPAFAGQFYPAEKSGLEVMLKDLYASASSKVVNNVRAIISPHAGYVFSGKIAASGFNQIDTSVNYENIFILASSHTAWFEGASIFTGANFVTPLGSVKVNTDLAQKLISGNDIFISDENVHIPEHSIEVQLPFLQYRLKKGFQIVPIIIGSQNKSDCQQIARALKPYFTDSNLFIISSDFSHYPSFDDAVKLDKELADIILSNDPELLFASSNNGEEKRVPGLSTRACGWTSILTLIYMTYGSDNLSYKFIEYENSGNSVYGDPDRVVGYNSIVVYSDLAKSSGFRIEPEEGACLLAIARETIKNYISENKIITLTPELYPEVLKTHCGVFVTLKKDGQLRGCIGNFNAGNPLFEIVQQMAIAASTQDRRFQPVSKNELDELTIEVSVLTPMRRLSSIDEIQLGKHGIYIKKGNHNGTFLPQVATETGWCLEEFLGHCSRDKAGLGWDGWKDAEIFIYEAIVFSEKLHGSK